MSTGLSPFNSPMGNTSESFPNPFIDVSSQSVPTTMRSALLWCLPPGGLVEMGDFSHIPVEKIEVGQTVRNKLGECGKVTCTSSRHYSGNLVAIQYGGCGKTMPYRMTPEHKLWLYENGDYRRISAAEAKEGDVVATPLPQWTARTSPRFSGWLLGMYVAEGCYILDGDRRLGVRFTCGADDETSGVLARLLDELRQATDLPVAPFTPPSRPDCRLVTNHDPELPDWCHEHGGRGATVKQLSGKVFDYGAEFGLALLAGWIDGDGWKSDTDLYGCTSSKALAIQIVRLANACGLTPSICLIYNNKGYGTENSRIYQIRFGMVDAAAMAPYGIKAKLVNAPVEPSRPRYRLKDGYVLRPIQAITSEAYDGPVHNFEVAGDHSYIVDGVTTSNCEYIFSTFGAYRMAMERIISYFLTDLDIRKVDEDEADKWRDFLESTVNALDILQCGLRDRMAYGNSFISMVVPFQRFLGCKNKKCGAFFTLKEVYENQAFRFRWEMPNFIASCPVCKEYRGPWTVDDRQTDNERKIRFKRWSPHEIELIHDPYSHEVSYIWRIPEDYKRLVKQGNLFHLERCPKPVIDAIHQNFVFKFEPDALYHMKEPTLAGALNRGWGISRIFQNWRQIYYVQVLHRYNEAIALDYVIPFRLITPAVRQGSSAGGGMAIDPLMMYNSGDFRSQVQSMIRRRRRDPASWQILPFPVNYQLLGGEATQLAPRDLLDQGMDTLLNNAGTPVELYKGSLQIQTAPVALRLFESTWHHLWHDANALLSWMVRQIAQTLSWEAIDVRLKRVTIADDVQRQMSALQLMMSNQLSGRSGLSAIGYDWDAEQKRLAEEAQRQAQLQSRSQEEMEQAGFAQQIAKGQTGPPGAAPGGAGGAGGAGGVGAPPGGAPAPAAGGDPNAAAAGTTMAGPVSDYLQSMSPSTPVSPEDMMSVADSIAQQLLGMPESAKDSELRKLKTANPTLHSLVRSRMDEIRDQTKSQAGNQAMGAMQQGGGAPAQAA